MAGIGEASAVIGVVQVGFSLARTLNTYIGDYKDSRDSIISLAAELDATIIQVKELNSLVADNTASNSLGEGSKKLAEKCVKDSERLIKRLVELLTKARLPEDPDAIVSIKPGDIIVGRLTRAYWPFIKPQVDVVKSELHVMKTDILLARSCIQSQSGSSPAVRAADGENIVALAKSRQLARKLLREAKAEEKRSVRAMQNPGSSSYPPRGRVPTAGDLYGVPGGGDDSSFRPYPPPPRRPTAQYHGDSRRPYVSVDDGKETELMAQDLREAILDEVKRKDDERKAKIATEEVARELAIESYQKTVREKLAQLQASREATQSQMERIFGPGLDKQQVQEFLDEQRSREMQDEFGQTLMQFGIGQQLPPSNSTSNGVANHNEEGARVPKRRWFFKRHSSRSSASTASIQHGTLGASNLSSQSQPQFLHIALAYDPVEGRYNYQPFDNPALKHHPCGPSCDIENTMRAWQAVPRSVKQSASRWVDDNYSDRIWQLHAALPFAKDARRTRKFLQKAILGEALHQGTSSILLVFSSTENYTASQADSTAAEDTKSETSRTSGPVSTGAASRVELSQADIEQMRDWLVARGLSTAKISELESIVVKPKASATTSAELKASDKERTSVEGQGTSALSTAPQGNGREPSTTVRFVDDGAAYKSKDAHNEWVTPRGAVPAPSFKINESAHKEDTGFYPPGAYSNRVSHQNADPFMYRGYSLNDDFAARDRSNNVERATNRSREYDEYERKLHNAYLDKELSALTRERDELFRRQAYPYNNAVDDVRERYRRNEEGPTRFEREDRWNSSRPWNDRSSRSPPPPPQQRPFPTSERQYAKGQKDPFFGIDKTAEAKSWDREDEFADARVVERPLRYTRHQSRSRDRERLARDDDVVEVIEQDVRSIHHSPSSSRSPKIRRYRPGSPARRSTFEQRSPVSREREEIVIRRRGSRGRYGSNDYPSYDAGFERNAYKDLEFDEWAFRPGYASTKPYVHAEAIHLPRASSPGDVRDDVSDEDDAILSDEELKDMMMIKYTGGTIPAAIPNSRGEAKSTEQDHTTHSSHRERSTPMIAELGIKRQNTATVEDEAEDESELRNQLSGSVAERDGGNQDDSAANNKAEPQTSDQDFGLSSDAPNTQRNVSIGNDFDARTSATNDQQNHMIAGGDNNDDQWGAWALNKKQKKKKEAHTTGTMELTGTDTTTDTNGRKEDSPLVPGSRVSEAESSRSRSRTRTRAGENAGADARSHAPGSSSDMDLYD